MGLVSHYQLGILRRGFLNCKRMEVDAIVSYFGAIMPHSGAITPHFGAIMLHSGAKTLNRSLKINKRFL